MAPQIGKMIEQSGEMVQKIREVIAQFGEMVQKFGEMTPQIREMIQKIGRLIAHREKGFRNWWDDPAIGKMAQQMWK